MSETATDWYFLSNYAHVLVCLAENPHARMRDVAERVGITERTTLRLVAQLDEAGILKRVKEGRRNTYKIDTRKHLRHPVESHCTVGDLLAMIIGSAKFEALEQGRNRPKRGSRA